MCPSADPSMENAVVVGVVGGAVDEPRVQYLKQLIPVTPKVLDLTGPARPAEVLRFAAPCAESACQHFDEQRCQLASRIVQHIAPSERSLPACRLRPFCRWWREQGRAACLRCPAIVRERYRPTPALIRAAGPGAVPRSDPAPVEDRRAG